MKVLLDEDVPEPLVPLLGRLLRGHDVQHVRDLKWKSKKDLDLFPDAPVRSGTIESKVSYWLWEALSVAYEQLGFEVVEVSERRIERVRVMPLEA